MKRRDVLGLLGGAALAPAARAFGQAPARPRVPRVNGAINVQPLRRRDPAANGVPGIELDLVDAQMRALYDLGFAAVRITVTFSRFGENFLAAIPYVRAARALGIDVLALVSDFSGYDLTQALVRPGRRDAVLRAYTAIFATPPAPAGGAGFVGGFAWQVLNEPAHFLGLAPDHYVQELLAPTYEDLKRLAPDVAVVAAAEIGNLDGIARLRNMQEAGVEAFCDRVAYHVYGRNLIPHLRGLARKPVWVTESGVVGTENHLAWQRDVLPEIKEGIGNVERVYYYDLYDPDPRRFRTIDIQPLPAGGVRVVAESADLVAHLQARVAAAANGQPTEPYATLVPDIGTYLATDADRAVIAAASFA
jgi:hypothetical protein